MHVRVISHGHRSAKVDWPRVLTLAVFILHIYFKININNKLYYNNFFEDSSGYQLASHLR